MPVIDCHAHFEPRMLALDDLIHKMDASGVDKVALIPVMSDPLPHTPDTLLAVLRGLLTSPLHACACWLNERFMTADGDLRLGGRVYRIDPLPDNSAVAAAIEKHPDRLLGWIFVNPRAMDDPIAELEKWSQIPGFIGVKLHPHWHRYPVEAALPIAERCQALGLPLLIHLGFRDAGQWEVIPDRCPDLRVIFAHAGIPHFGRMWERMKKHRHLFVDVSSPYLSERVVRSAARALGPHRVLYGTDSPYGFPRADGTYDYGHIKGWVERLPCRSVDIDRISGDTFAEVLTERRSG